MNFGVAARFRDTGSVDTAPKPAQQYKGASLPCRRCQRSGAV